MLQLLQLHSGGFNAETSIISCPGCAFLGPPLTLPYRKHYSRLKRATYETRVGIFPQGMNALIGFHVGRFKLVVERKEADLVFHGRAASKERFSGPAGGI